MAVDPSCHCGQAESLLHLFTWCPIAKRLLAWYQSLLRHAVPQAVCPTSSQILVGYGSSVKLPPMFPCLLGISQHQIWVTQNGYRFKKVPVVYRTVLSSIKSSLRFTVRVQCRHSPRHLFLKSWLARVYLALCLPMMSSRSLKSSGSILCVMLFVSSYVCVQLPCHV